ncbi:hypothetical protein EAF04_007684 [Stromatinia cepivora]|nr:hypothetical protein EAF04_007684 [Stromatinia cepivora]
MLPPTETVPTQRQRCRTTWNLGVNTGVGRSAYTQTNRVDEFQQTIIRELQSGIISGPEANLNQASQTPNGSIETARSWHKKRLPADHDTVTYMPKSWVRASILIRINSLAKGHSGVRLVLIQRLLDLLSNDIIPLIPLRGSISASEDLMPLSYIGGALTGSCKTLVWTKLGQGSTADIALKEASLEPIILGPKEGLAIVNGTSVSAGIATLVPHGANCLVILSQVLTAMSTEALNGSDESRRSLPLEEGTLPQDRYAIRTSSQWIGPVLEDLHLATRQLRIECNSATDNPLLEMSVNFKRLLSGGNFQAKAVTSAMEKARVGLQSLGQMLFAQCTELINPMLNNGLPPNLVATEPSRSFLMKPLDVMMASLQSELGFLANPVGSHVLSAEMGNQSLNSPALISARLLDALRPHFEHFTIRLLKVLNVPERINELCALLWSQMIDNLDSTTSMDSSARFDFVCKALQPTVLDLVGDSSPCALLALKEWTQNCSNTALKTFQETRASYAAHPYATPLLGNASRRMYEFVRGQLSIPFAHGDEELALKETTGSLVTQIYEAICSGTVFILVMDSLREVMYNRAVDCEVKCKL